jgi:hypothetical protein
VIACTSDQDKQDPDNRKVSFDSFPLDVPEQNALMTKWEQKEVIKSKIIDDFETAKNWQVTGIGEMNYTDERSHEGNRSLRFRTSLRDEEFYRNNRTEWDSFGGRQGGTSFVQLRFDETQDWTDYNRISFWVYVHPTSMPTYCIHIRMNCEDAVQTALDYNNVSHFVQDLKPGEWNHVLFEIPHLQRDKVSSFTIFQMLRGHNPEEEGIVTYDIDRLEIQQVKTDKYEGWEVEEEKFAFSHIGYLSEGPKIAMAGTDGGDKFQIIDSNEREVFSKDVRVVRNKQGTFRILDFSEFRGKGKFRIKYGNQVSYSFPIDDDIWISPLFKAVNFFFCERCGYHVPGVHLECHKDWQGFHGDIKKIINGGWHDAGDLSQGSWRTAMATLAMMMNLQRLDDYPEYEELTNRIRDEIAWGLEWLLKTRFGDGYHMSFSVMRIYTDNEVGTIDDVVSPAKNVPWENFLAAAVQCKAATILESSHPELAGRSRIAAIEDWEAAMASQETWQQADYREAAWGATSSIWLSEMTGEDRYLEQAIHFGNMLTACQEQEFVDGIPITGYFYTNTDKEEVIHNRHAAFEEAPLIALNALCDAFPEHENWIDWYGAAVLHSEYFMKRGSQIAAPFDLLPNSVWKKSEILAQEEEDRRRDMMRQFNDGTPLGNDYVLRTFPIYYDGLFHGNTNIHMSSTWALAEASDLRKDAEGMELVGKQFQWIFGGNPFSQSLMYGEGYDFPPHFAYCLKDLVGALPVGMDCMSGDDPHWSATNIATYKEIWVEPVNRFMGALSVYLSDLQRKSESDMVGEEVLINLQADMGSPDSKRVHLNVSSDRKIRLSVRTFNLEHTVENAQISLNNNESGEMKMDLNIKNPDKPYIVVLTNIEDPDQRWEAVGARVNPMF